jgi:hypothetical protein
VLLEKWTGKKLLGFGFSFVASINLLFVGCTRNAFAQGNPRWGPKLTKLSQNRPQTSTEPHTIQGSLFLRVVLILEFSFIFLSLPLSLGFSQRQVVPVHSWIMAGKCSYWGIIIKKCCWLDRLKLDYLWSWSPSWIIFEFYFFLYLSPPPPGSLWYLAFSLYCWFYKFVSRNHPNCRIIYILAMIDFCWFI